MSWYKLENDKALLYILSGRAIFTLQSNKTGDHYTYKVKRDKKQVSLYYVSVFYTKGWLYIGALSTATNKFYNNVKGTSVEAFNWLYNKLHNHQEINATIYHYGRCGHCGKILTNPISIERGLGDKCYEFLNKTRFVHPELYKNN